MHEDAYVKNSEIVPLYVDTLILKCAYLGGSMLEPMYRVSIMYADHA